MFDAGQAASEGWVLKGGYALELRFHRARSTKDLDLTVRLGTSGPGEHEGDLRERLQQAAEIPLPDFFTFIVGEESLALDQAPADLQTYLAIVTWGSCASGGTTRAAYTNRCASGVSMPSRTSRRTLPE